MRSISFLLYAAGVQPKAVEKALVRASCEEYPNLTAMSMILSLVSRMAKVARARRLPEI